MAETTTCPRCRVNAIRIDGVCPSCWLLLTTSHDREAQREPTGGASTDRRPGQLARPWQRSG
jgi:hypothetical protein